MSDRDQGLELWASLVIRNIIVGRAASFLQILRSALISDQSENRRKGYIRTGFNNLGASRIDPGFWLNFQAGRCPVAMLREGQNVGKNIHQADLFTCCDASFANTNKASPPPLPCL